MSESPSSLPPSPAAPFATRAQLLAWLEQHRLMHTTRLNLEAAAPFVDPRFWPQLPALAGRKRLLDLASEDWRERSAAWLDLSPLKGVLPAAVWAFLQAERDQARLAEGEVRARLEVPELEAARGPHASLRVLRGRIPPSAAARPSTGLPLASLRAEASLPGFRFLDTLPVEARLPTTGGFVRPEVLIQLVPGAPAVRCSCRDEGCVHQLAAIDTALIWLKQPTSAAFLRTLAELNRPPWERTLAALEAALSPPKPESADFELQWRIAVDEPYGVEVSAWVSERRGKRRLAAAQVPKRRLLQDHSAHLNPTDARIAALLPDDDRLASRALLDALVDHPGVGLASDPERAVRVDRAKAGIVAEARGGGVRVTAGVDGASFPPALLERVRRARADTPLYLWDSRRLTLLDVPPELREMLGVLQKGGDLFPPESQGELLTALGQWAERLPVAMPRSLRGEKVAASTEPMLRLEGQPNGAVHVELRVRPLAGGPSFRPGQGPRDVHVRRSDLPLHAVRDLPAEGVRARAFAADLLSEAEPTESAHPGEAVAFRFPSAQGALELLAACASLEAPPEVEWVGAPLALAGKAGARALKIAVPRHREWFGLLGELAVGGERIELARLLDSARRHERYVQINATTYAELDEALRRHLDQLLPHVREGRRGLEVGPSAHTVLTALERAGAALGADAHWRGLLARVEAAAALKPALPATFNAHLRPYQRAGFEWMCRLAAWEAGGVLADDMGLGKTVQALALLLARGAQGPALVVAPTSVVFNWADEAGRFTPTLRPRVYAEAPDRASLLASLGPGDVLLISYGLLVRDAALLAALPFDTVIFDEAQNLKNAQTQRARAARALQAKARFALSGTPIENHVGEVWSLYSVVFPALLGSWEAFRKRWGYAIERRLDPEAAPALARVLRPFLLRRTKLEVEADLPPRLEVRVPVVLSAAEWQLYEDARLAALHDLETSAPVLKAQERRLEVLAALTRLRLLASHPRLYDDASPLASSKLTRLLELVAELAAAGQRALIFSQFTSHLALVREALDARGAPYAYLDGQTPAGERRARVAAFQSGQLPLFLISLKAGGVGLNLTAATAVIHLDPWWNPAVEDQASDRAHRIGQTEPVTVLRLVALGTIEEEMLNLHEEKRDLVARVLAGADGARELDTTELIGLLAARPRGARRESDA